jgi:DNA-directed RNA polymerase specialized sigma24 family protein
VQPAEAEQEERSQVEPVHGTSSGPSPGPAAWTGDDSDSPLDDLSSRELLATLDEELQGLPETFRLPLILCCLEGRSLDEAATVLGWTVGSVKGRLERGRQRLQDRLAAHGLTFAVAAGVPLLAERPALAGLLRQAVLRAVRHP